MTTPTPPTTQPAAATPVRPGRSPAVLATTTAVVVVLGAVAGAVWSVITPATTGLAVRELRRDEIPAAFDAVAPFTLTMFTYGAVAALLAWFAARRWRGVAGLVCPAIGTAVGSLVAIGVGMWLAGMRFDDPEVIPPRSTFAVAPDLWLDGGTRSGFSAPWILMICAPFAFTVVYLVCVLSSREPDLGVGDVDADVDSAGFDSAGFDSAGFESVASDPAASDPAASESGTPSSPSVTSADEGSRTRR